MEEKSTTNFLRELNEGLLHNIIYYIPSELIFEGILNQIKDLPDYFFDELSLIDINKGIYQIYNKDALEINQLLLKKRNLLEKNIFKLVDLNKDLTPIEFQITIEKYFDQLQFYQFITDWLFANLKKYNEEELHFTFIGAFKLQNEYLSIHLNNIQKYFGASLQFEQANFTSEKLVTEYFPGLISTFSQAGSKNQVKTENENEIEISCDEKVQETTLPINQPGKKKPRKKERPQLIDKEVEKMILETVFKVQMD